MEQGDRLLNAMFEMCNHKNPLNDGQREWHIADIPGLLREERYDELDERYNQALTESFTSREAEKRYFFAWNQMDNPFYDMDTLVEAGPQGLALIKNWQRAGPALLTPGLPRRNTGITVRGCIAAMAGREKPPERCGSALPPATNGWSSPCSMLSTVNRASGWRRP